MRHSPVCACQSTSQQCDAPGADLHSRIATSILRISSEVLERAGRPSLARNRSRAQSLALAAAREVASLCWETRRWQPVCPYSRTGNCASYSFDCNKFLAGPRRGAMLARDGLPLRKCLVTLNVSFLAGLAAFAGLSMALPGWAAAGACHSLLLSWSGAEQMFARIPAKLCVRPLVIPHDKDKGSVY